jgi:anaphase-promoting complex subunit 10
LLANGNFATYGNGEAEQDEEDDAEVGEEEYDDEEEEEEEVDDYDDEEDEMDDGSTAVTIRAPTERRSSLSTPIWSTTGMSSIGGGVGGSNSNSTGGDESHDEMGTTTNDVGIVTQTSAGTATTTTSVAPMNNPTDGTDTDELLVGSGSSADGGDTTIAGSTSNTTAMIISAVPNLHSLFEKPYLREIGTEDILSFQLSSAKPGNGVEQLYDPSLETYWQSDGTCQPHWIQIQLPRRLPVTHVALYLDYQLDESYTPRTVQIDTGLTVVQKDSSSVLSDAPVMELHEPVGWCIFPIYIPPDPFDTNHSDHGGGNVNPGGGGVTINETTMIPRAHWVRISVVSMHQNGRDTHVRRVALFCQRTSMTLRMPQPSHISHTFSTSSENKPIMVNHTNVSLLKEGMEEDGESNTDHEEILLYARTRATGRNYDPIKLPQRRIGMEQPSSLFGTIR